jgi:ABC-type oligopeptide transport system substrate-binding subunit
VASSLENLSGPGKSLQKEPPDAKEFAGLKRSALARLTDSAKNSNSLESRFDLAYNAAHALCLAACPALPHAAHYKITLRLSRAAHQRSWRPRMFDGGADESRERELHHGRN